MKIGLSTLYLTTKPFKQAVKTLENLSGECKIWEIVDECKLRLNKLKVQTLKELKKSFSFEYTVHSPFCDINIASINPQIRRFTLKIIKKSMMFAREIEAKMYVIHPGFYDLFNLKTTEKLNLQSVKILAKYAEDLGVPIALENLPKELRSLTKVEDFERFFGMIDEAKLWIALDVGHAYTVRQLNLFLEKFKDKIKHVHLHNNNGDGDFHLGLDEGSIDWKNVVRRLKENGFNGFIVVEATSKPFESYLKLKHFTGEL
jgi:sugar phosphate isomerase/epimerase